MTRGLLPPTLVVALLGVSCIESWKGVDGDGDGYSVAQGDCWDSLPAPTAAHSPVPTSTSVPMTSPTTASTPTAQTTTTTTLTATGG